MKKRKDYATTLTKDYLMKLGITDVTPDGLHIYSGSEELAQYIPKTKNVKRRYFRVSLYDPELRQATPKEERTNTTGTIIIPAHVINYVWNKGTRTAGMVCDHIDNNPLNNHIDNLQLITQRENVIKEREASTKEIKCKLDRPLSYYEDKLVYYEDLYQKAVAEGNQEEAHKQRGNTYTQRAKIRYWLSHKEEAEVLIAKKQASLENKIDSDVYHAKAQVIKLLNESINAKRIEYKNALETYGKDHEITHNYKVEWKNATRDLSDFRWETKVADVKYLSEVINKYLKRIF